MIRRVFAVASTLLALAGCSSMPDTGPMQPGQAAQSAKPVTVSGAVEKGPFVLGSTVTVTPSVATSVTTGMPNTKSSAALAGSTDDSATMAEGKVYTTETSNDRGEFSVSLAYQGPVSVEATGYYYNEAVGQLSGAPLTLRAVSAVGDADAQLNVNLITHLTYQRVKTIMAGGAEFAEASAQAESELQAELGFGNAPSTAATKLSLEGGDTDESAYLFAASTVFAQAAYLDSRTDNCSNCIDAKVQELVNTTSAAFAVNGTLPTATKDKLAHARQTIDNAKVEAALAARLMKTGSTAKVPSLDRVIPWSVPQAVTDCASSALQSVSLSCRMAICGANSRPAVASELQALQNRQTQFGASSCGEDCWAAMRCTVANCAKIVDGTLVLDGSCVACPLEDFGNGPLAASASHLAAMVSDSRECDADLGIAK